jgi:hypothetical protein
LLGNGTATALESIFSVRSLPRCHSNRDGRNGWNRCFLCSPKRVYIRNLFCKKIFVTIQENIEDKNDCAGETSSNLSYRPAYPWTDHLTDQRLDWTLLTCADVNLETEERLGNYQSQIYLSSLAREAMWRLQRSLIQV